MKKFKAYIALGDSMSIDLYPALDKGLEPNTQIGASALFYRNNKTLWPEFEGKDLKTLYPEITFLNLAEDGATTWDMMEGYHQEAAEKYVDEPVLVTVTLGGNDALRLLWIDPSQPAKLTSEAENIVDRYRKVMDRLASRFKNGTFILSSIYDPSDGTGLLKEYDGYPKFADKLPFLGYLNHQIKAYAGANNHLFADVHEHFLGHGVTAPVEKRWYWRTNPIEPSARGASELRLLWLRALKL